MNSVVVDRPVFDWNSPVTINGKEEPVDCLDRAKYAEFLTNYLSGFTEQSYVMNLNAEWGAGKTYFLKRWQETIKDTYPTAYIDAWKHDFDNEPLLTVISGITKALEDACPNVGASQKQEAVYKSGKYLLSSITDAVSVSGFGVNFDLGKAKSTFSQKRSDNELKVRLRLHNKKIDQIEVFKEKLKEWLEEVIGYAKLKKPMFVFIDELDRCRPTYGIEMLEVIKHLFDIKGLVFVVSTNTDQLQHSIKAVYGDGFDSSTYLRRFFLATYSLKKPDYYELFLSMPVFQSLSEKLLRTCDGRLQVQDEDGLCQILSGIAESLDMDMRTAIQWLNQIDASFSKLGNNLKRLNWIGVAILLAVKFKINLSIKDIDVKDGLKNVKFKKTFNEIKVTFSIKDWPSQYFQNRQPCSNLPIEDNMENLIVNMVNFLCRPKLIPLDYISKINSPHNDVREYSLLISLLYCAEVYGTESDDYFDLVNLATDLR